MVLAFYSVDSKLERHAFDGYNLFKKEDCIKAFKALTCESNTRFYDVDSVTDMDMFQEDYNDEMLDGGFWVVVLWALTRKDFSALLNKVIVVSDIDWDVDGVEDENDIDLVLNLPKEIKIALPADFVFDSTLEDFVSDYLSATYGFCHKGFTITSFGRKE